MSSNGINCH